MTQHHQVPRSIGHVPSFCIRFYLGFFSVSITATFNRETTECGESCTYLRLRLYAPCWAVGFSRESALWAPQQHGLWGWLLCLCWRADISICLPYPKSTPHGKATTSAPEFCKWSLSWASKLGVTLTLAWDWKNGGLKFKHSVRAQSNDSVRLAADPYPHGMLRWAFDLDAPNSSGKSPFTSFWSPVLHQGWCPR